MLKKYLLTAACLAGACLAAAPASAASYLFTLTGSYSATWVLDSNPVPTVPVPGLGFLINDVSGTYDGTASPLADLTFYAAGLGGGLEIDDPSNGDAALLVTNGPQLYSGGEDAPQLLLGTFDLTQYAGAGTYTLTVRAAPPPVPEPATWAMMLVGTGFIGIALRRRKQAAPILA